MGVTSRLGAACSGSQADYAAQSKSRTLSFLLISTDTFLPLFSLYDALF